MKSQAAADRLRGAALRRQCVALRATGLSYEAIGERVGCSRQNAWKHVTAAFDDIRTKTAENAVILRDLELERLDRMLEGVWEAATTGDVSAVDRALRISERRAKLLGLDAPAKFAGHDGGPITRTWVDIGRELMSDEDAKSLAQIASRVVTSEKGSAS